MIRDTLRDSAVAIAKACCHERAEPRHVLFAVARHFRERTDVANLFAIAKSALDPRGTCCRPPGVSSEAEALLGSISTDEDAVAALIDALKPQTKPQVRTSGDTGVQTAHEQSTSPDPARTPEPSRPSETTSAILSELDSLIGLAAVKSQVRNIVAVVQANQERSRAGLTAVNPGLHLVFTGPPGTGKTTVARLVARLYASTGALPGANFTEATRSDLVAGYVGQTAIKTTEVITKTRPGVLFIDEAYALAPRYDSDFGAEAIATLVKAMEDHRNELAVIVAGYSEEMGRFVGSNPGLRSRFKTFIEFPDYGADELVRIFERFAQENALRLGGGVLEKARQVFDTVVAKEDFGNARFARSLFEQAYARMATRAAADGTITVDELLEIAPEDVELDQAGFAEKGRRIGFGRESIGPVKTIGALEH